ncbi:MAG: sugar ABC transporter permease [Arthrobacter sp.]|nr:sugar ABC transporter permease [Arthrobacter sp.]
MMSVDAPASPAPEAAPPTAGATPIRRRRRSLTPWLLIAPALVIIIAAMGYPIFWQLKTSFQKYGLKQQFNPDLPPDFVGFDNYVKVLTNPDFLAVLGRSILFCFLAAFITVILGFLLALLMKRVGKVARLILQIALLLAWAMPVAASMTVWVWLVDWRNGVLNYLLGRLGLDVENHNWLADPTTFFVIALIIVIWAAVPFVALSIYAGLSQISEEVLEAAQMDGATGWQRTRYITLPLIAPVLSIVLLLQIVWDLRVFTQIKFLQDAGGVANATDLLGTYIYKMGVGSADFGSAAAVSVIMLLLTVALSWYYVRSIMKEED